MKSLSVRNESGEDLVWAKALDFLWLEITPRCNLNCVHCYADSSPFNPLTVTMQFEDWVSVLKQGSALGCKQVQFIGGEPTLHPDLGALICKAKEYGFEFIEVYSNGTRISPNLFQLFSDNGVHLAFSFYSSSPEAHDRITRQTGSQRRTLDAIRTSVALGLDVRASVILMEENRQQERETLACLESLGVKRIGVDRIRGVGRGIRSVQAPDDPINELCGACWKGQLTVDSAGNAFPCIFSRFNMIGNVEEGLAHLLRTDSLQKFRERVKAMDFARKSARRSNLAVMSAASCGPEAGDAYCGPASRETTGTCSPDYCGPDKCSPDKECSPDCGPYCRPNCSPFENCRPK